MTIRQFVKRRFLWSIGFVVAAVLPLVIMGTLQNEQATPYFVAFGFITFAIGAGLVNFGIRCPKCKGNLGVTIVPAMFSFSSKHPVKFCPYCGVSIEEEC